MQVLLALVVSVVLGYCAHAQDTPLQLAGRIPLPGVTGRIDHMAIDIANGRLFVAALGSDSLEVVNLRQGKRTHIVTQLSEPQGVAYLPDTKRLVISNARDGTCRVLDSKTLNLITRVDLGDDADNLRYYLAVHRLLVGYGDGAIGIFNAQVKQVGKIPVPGHPEAFVLDSKDSKLYINVPDIDSVIVADLDKRQVVDTWKLRNERANFPMALDEVNHLLLVGTRAPARIVGLDTQTGQSAFAVPIDGDADDLYIDSQRRRVYVSCGAGYLDVFDRTKAGEFRPMKRIPTAPRARTSLFVPEMDRLYLAVPQHGQQDAAVWVYKVQ